MRSSFVFTPVLLVLALGIGILACRKDDSPMDPCAESQPVSASFSMYEDWDPVAVDTAKWEYYDTDTSCSNIIRLVAHEQGASYLWRIGTDTNQYTKPNFRIVFPSTWVSRTSGRQDHDIKVTLIVRKVPDKRCYPQDDGIDSVTRNLHIVTDTAGTLIPGTYQGYWQDMPYKPGKACIVSINKIFYPPKMPGDLGFAYLMENVSPKRDFDPQSYYKLPYCSYTDTGGFNTLGYRQAFGTVQGGQYALCTFRLDKNNILHINGYDWQYSYPSHDFPQYIHHFIGKKVSN